MPVFNLPPEYFELTFDTNKGEVIVYHVLEKKDDSKIFTLEDLNTIIYEAQLEDGYPDLKFPFYTGGTDGHAKHSEYIDEALRSLKEKDMIYYSIIHPEPEVKTINLTHAPVLDNYIYKRMKRLLAKAKNKTVGHEDIHEAIYRMYRYKFADPYLIKAMQILEFKEAVIDDEHIEHFSKRVQRSLDRLAKAKMFAHLDT